MKVRVESALLQGEHRGVEGEHRGRSASTGGRGRAQGIAPTMVRLRKAVCAGWQCPVAGRPKGRPYYGTASHAGACRVAKERFFPFTRTFRSLCHMPIVIHAPVAHRSIWK